MAIQDNILNGAGLQYLWDYKIIPQLNAKANTSSLATVATTGSYSNLSDKPKIDNLVTVGSTNAVQSDAVYNFVNSSIATNTAYFIGTFTSVSELHAYSGAVTNNDYGFVVSDYVLLTDEPDDWFENYESYYTKSVVAPIWVANKYYAKNDNVYTLTTSEPESWSTNYAAYYTLFNETEYTPVIGIDKFTSNHNDTFALNTYYAFEENTYSRYKYTPDHWWQFEYTLNNSSFTAAQWATIQSGFTSDDKSLIMATIDHVAYYEYTVSQVYASSYGSGLALFTTTGGTSAPFVQIDLSPTMSSGNLITSGAVYSGLRDKADSATTLAGYGITDAHISDGTITLGYATITPLTSSDVASTYSSSGTSPVNGKAINAAIGTLDVSSVGGSGKYIQSISETNGKISATAGTIDTTPTSASTNPITSGAVYTPLTEDRAALVELVDSGPKNLVDPLAAVGYNYQGSYPSTIGGCTYTLNSDGSIAVGGKPSVVRAFKIPISVEIGKTYVLSGCPSGGGQDSYRLDIRDSGTTNVIAEDNGSSTSFTASASTYDVVIRIASGYTVSQTFYIMVCESSLYTISDDYVPYDPSNKDALISIIDNGPKNILNFTGYQASGNTGLTITPNADGSFTFSGTASSTATYFMNFTFSESKQYALSGAPSNNSNITLRLRTQANNDVAVDTGSGAIFMPTANTTYIVMIRLAAGTYTNDTVYPMICERAAWDISHTYVPYRPSYQELYNRVVALEQAAQ